MKNPILEEAAEVYMRRREYLWFHVVYAAAIALFTVMVWPARGFMYFFRTESVPAVFQATVVVHVLVVTAVSIYVGLDRLADSQIIRYSEWLERTAIPVGALFRGKMTAAVVHTLFLTAVGVPFAIVAAGPSGTPIAAVLASETIVLLSGLAGRVAGMLISHVGEYRYVVRVVGAWLYIALLFVATVQLYRPLNPIVAVVRQHLESSPFMQPSEALPLPQNPLVASGVPMLILVLVLAGVYRITLARHRKSVLTRTQP